MKAAVLMEKDRMEIARIPRPEVEEEGVLVSMTQAAVCGTDLKLIRSGHRDLSLPRILGHEGMGEITASRHPAFQKGDRVAIYPGCFCGDCPACRAGHTSRCETIRIYGFNRDGLFRTVIPFSAKEVSSLVRIPEKSDPGVVLAEPVACCLSALGRFRYLEKTTALVVGAGAVGSLFTALLLAEGWKTVLVADRNPRRLSSGLPRGVLTMASGTGGLRECLERDGWGGKIGFLAPCCPSGLDWPFWEVMRPGGGVSFFSGRGRKTEPLALDADAVHYLGLTLAGSYGCDRKDFVFAASMLARKRLDLSFLDCCRVSLSELEAGLDRLRNGRVRKVIIDRF